MRLPAARYQGKRSFLDRELYKVECYDDFIEERGKLIAQHVNALLAPALSP